MAQDRRSSRLVGDLNLQGSGVVSLTNDVFGIGEHGVGSFDLSNSAQATAPRVALGRYADGRGSVFQNGSSTLTVNGTGSDGNGTPNYALAIGAQSTALSSYTITGGTLNVTGGNLLVGMTSGSNGRMTLAASGIVAASHELHVGESGTGTLVVNGGQFTAAGQMIVGNTNGASGTVTQNGGTLGLTGGSLLVLGNQGRAVGSYTLGGGTLAAGGRILVGEDGLASFTQTAGANNVTQDVSIGDHVGFSTVATPDTYSISGGTLSASALQIGWQGYAVMNQSGGTVTTTTDVHFGGSANGNAQNGRGIYNLSGGTLITPSIFASSAGNLAHQFNFSGGTLRVGAYNTTGTTSILGTLMQTSASNPSLLDVTTQSTTIGASYSLSGQNATARIDNGNTLHVEGIVSIDNGAAVTMTNGVGNQLLIDGSGMTPNNSLNIGIAGTGTFTQNGGTNAAGNLVLGGQASGNGVYSLNGGTLIAGGISGGPGSSTFNLNGGTIQASGPSATFFQGISSAVVQSGGGFINTTGNNITVAQNLLHDPLLGMTADGGLAKNGAGTLTLGGANSYSGPTNVTAGTLRLAAPTLLSGGSIFSSPVGTGTLALAAGATLQDDGVPRTLADNLVINGSVTFSSAGVGSITFDSSGLTTPTTVTFNNNPTLTVTNTTTIKSATILNAGTFAKSGSGTLEIDAAPMLAANSAIQVAAGVLRFKIASGSAAVGTGVAATVTAGATLELAGSISALSAGANRVNVSNNSQATAGGLLISGTNQQVGAIDGLGNLVVGSDGSLTANHIIQNALFINGTAGHPATVTIAASDSAGNLMAARTSGFSPSIAAPVSSPIEQISAGMLSSFNPPSEPVSALSPVAATDLSTVPEPSAMILFAFGLVALALFRRNCLLKTAFAFQGESEIMNWGQ